MIREYVDVGGFINRFMAKSKIRIQMSTSVVKSPFTGGKAEQVYATEEMEFRGETYLVHSQYYRCEDTGEKFTTVEQDTATFNDLYSQYRIKHGIPFPDEIKAIRQRYGMNYSQIGKLLGFGVNQWAKYETGQVPSESNGRLIGALRRKEVTLNLLNDLKDMYEPDEYEKTLKQILTSPDTDTLPSENHYFYEGTVRSINNGYGEFNHKKVEEMVKYLVKGGTYPTKLNKKMFYSDFLHFKRYGISISGLRYQAIKYGPVPVHYSTIYDHVPGLESMSIYSGDKESTLLTLSTGPDTSIFSQEELSTLEEINNKLEPLPVKEIIELSHKEAAWINNYPQKGIIPFSEAYTISL